MRRNQLTVPCFLTPLMRRGVRGQSLYSNALMNVMLSMPRFRVIPAVNASFFRIGRWLSPLQSES